MTQAFRVRAARRGAEAVKSRVVVTAAEAAAYHADLPAVSLGLPVGLGEQALTEPHRAQPTDWYDPDLVSGHAGARVAQNTGPFALA